MALATAFYVLLTWAKQARALRIAIGIVGLHAGASVARNFDLVITTWVLDVAAGLLVVLLLVVFQPELRHAVMRLDSLLRVWPRPAALLTRTSRASSNAAFALARARVGALIVIVQGDSIAELTSGGIPIGAEVSAEILEAIFQKSSPLHDGAVVVQGDRIRMANVILPLTQRADLPAVYGTRHRAAIGLAERCDALVVVASEERGEVTLMDGRQVRLMRNAGELAGALQMLQTKPRVSLAGRVRRILLSNLGFKFAAVGLAALMWGASILATGTTVRAVTAPVEFSDIPTGLEIAEQSLYTLEVQVRASTWLMNSVGLSNLVAEVNLSNGREGWQRVTVKPDAFNLPPGIVIERVAPPGIAVRLVRRPEAKSP